jgi:hypothetical protein
MKPSLKNVTQLPLQPFRLAVWAETAMVALILMECSWLTTWYAAYYSWRVTWAGAFFVLAVIALVSHYLARAMDVWGWRPVIRRIVYTLWVLAALLASLKLLVYANQTVTFFELFTRPFWAVGPGGVDRGEFVHIVLIAGLALRGASLARNPVINNDFRASFIFGLLVLLIFGLVFPHYPTQQTGFALYFYLFVSLIGLSAIRIARLSILRGGRLPDLNFFWLAGILLSVMVVVLIGILSGALMQGFVAQILAKIVVLLVQIVLLVCFVALMPLLFVLILLIPWLASLFKLNNLNQVIENMQNLTKIAVQENSGQISKTADLIGQSRPFVLLAILAGILVIILIGLNWRSWRARLLGEGQSSSLNINPEFKIPPILKNLGQRMNLFNARRALAAERIRRIYAQLMILSAKLGVERPVAITPLEFLPQLQQLFPDEVVGLTTITHAYVQIRYGELPENEQEVNKVLAAWENIHKTGQQKLAENRRRLKEAKKQS